MPRSGQANHLASFCQAVGYESTKLNLKRPDLTPQFVQLTLMPRKRLLDFLVLVLRLLLCAVAVTGFAKCQWCHAPFRDFR